MMTVVLLESVIKYSSKARLGFTTAAPQSLPAPYLLMSALSL